MQKQYIDYDSDNEDIKYSDKDLDCDDFIVEDDTEEENLNEREHNEDYLTNHDELIDAPDLIEDFEQYEFKNLKELKEIKEIEQQKMNRSNKEYIIDDFEYKDDEIKVNAKEKKKRQKKNKKQRKSKVITYFLNFIYSTLRVLFLILLVLLLTNIKRFYDLKTAPKETINKTIDMELEEDIVEIIENIDAEYSEYKKIIVEYILSLNEIIEGEKSCIRNLNDGIITSKDVYNYFSKSLNNKTEILNNFSNEDFPKEFSSLKNKVSQVFINSNNNSKFIINRHLGSESTSKMITDMNNFITKHNEDILLLQEILDKIK